MKSAYELAMERLNKQSPTAKLSGAQKKALSELDARYTAKIAEREIALNAEMRRMEADPEQLAELRQQLQMEKQKLQAELEDKKEAVRAKG